MSDDLQTIMIRPTNRRPFQIRGEMIACAETEEDMSRFQRCAILRMHDGRLVAEYSRLTSWENERQYRAFAICADAAEVEGFYRRQGPFNLEFPVFLDEVFLAQDAMRKAGLDLSPKLIREIEAYDAALTAELAEYDERYERC